MTATGVVVVTSLCARQWVGHRQAPRMTVQTLREVRSVGRIVVCNFTSGDLPYDLDAEVVRMPQSWSGPPPMSVVYAAIEKLALDAVVVCCHPETPLLSPATVEKCAEAVLAGVHVAQTGLEADAWLPAHPGGPLVEAVAVVPVLGCRAFRGTYDWGRFPAGLAAGTAIRPVLVPRKEALSLADPGDLELVQALEFAGSV